jgi:glycosyltransferase involved in cell wall biosynthesis
MRVMAAALRAGMASWQEQSLPCACSQGPSLEGVVYTSVFNPDDPRKNWEDMITAFLAALGDCEDATLVMKLATSSPTAAGRILAFYRRLDVSHRCRLVVTPDFLSDAEMLRLAGASTFYLTTTRAEGMCLPLMNHLAAGRPAVAPAHTAIADYFDATMGLVVESHPEPCAWPHDTRRRWRTTWHRLVWPSLVEQIRRSYQIAKSEPATYQTLAAGAQERMRRWAHPEAVLPRLQAALESATASSPSKFDAAKSAAATRYDHPAPPLARPHFLDRRRASRPLRAVVSLLNFRPGQIGGTETYLRQLIARLPQVAPQHEIVLLMDRELTATNPFPGIERAVVDLSARQVLRARALEALTPYRARSVERAIEQLRPDVVLFPQQAIFPKHVAAPCVLVVHDLYHLVLPQYLSPGQRLMRQRSYARSIARADRIIAISQCTKKSVQQHYGIAANQITVIPHGYESVGAGTVNDHPETAETQPSKPYVYYPAITRPHKNHHVLFQSIAKLKAQGRFDLQLILTGIQTPHWKTLHKLIRRLNLEGTVQHLGYVPFERVRQLYRDAACVVFPSSFEGFGLPVVEACQAGKKLLVSRLEVFHEIGVPERFQIDFADPEQLHRGLAEPGVTVLEKRPWTWDEAAAATMATLSSAVADTPSPRVQRRAA